MQHTAAEVFGPPLFFVQLSAGLLPVCLAVPDRLLHPAADTAADHASAVSGIKPGLLLNRIPPFLSVAAQAVKGAGQAGHACCETKDTGH